MKLHCRGKTRMGGHHWPRRDSGNPDSVSCGKHRLYRCCYFLPCDAGTRQNVWQHQGCSHHLRSAPLRSVRHRGTGAQRVGVPAAHGSGAADRSRLYGNCPDFRKTGLAGVGSVDPVCFRGALLPFDGRLLGQACKQGRTIAARQSYYYCTEHGRI